MRPTLAPAAVAGTIAVALAATPTAAAAATPAPPHRAAPIERMPRAAAVPAVASAPSASTHTVRPGDTVSAVAAAAGLRTADVLALNGLDWSSIIHPGQVLLLSAGAAPASTAPAAPAPRAVHTVVAGDTLWAIAEAGGVSLEALLSANALARDSIIYPGQDLTMPAPPASAPAMTPAALVAPLGLDHEQIANARLIIAVGRERGVPDRGIAVALATGMVESWLRNLDWGDRDSLGLFQQRPSQGWGSPEQVRDPARATAVFYGGAADPNGAATRGLLDIPGWEEMGFSEAAQAVQISAFPDRYGQWEQQAYSWLAALG
jgi:LysM repeat protein